MKLADIFCDNMVLQREHEICVFGSGTGKGKIEFCGHTTEFTSDSESFRVYLPPESAGGPHEMKVTLENETVTLKNILIGDVYLAAGQSNMEFTLDKTTDIELTDCPDIRYFKEPHNANPELNVTYDNKGWQICEKDEPMSFSAIGYYFALKMHKETNVPIGIVSVNKGASTVDGWTAPEFTTTAEYQKMVEIRLVDYHRGKFNQNNWLYINKLLPVVPYGIKAVLWYQGESNRLHEEGIHYAEMLKIMIENWRNLWNESLPFYLVQLMPYADPYGGDWAVIREQQELSAKTVPEVYLTTLVKTGEAQLIHPTRKKEVAYALANAVLTTKFDKNLEYCGPVKESYELTENRIKIHFSHADGLNIQGKYLEDTFVYDDSGEAFTVSAKTENNTLILTWQKEVKAVRITMGYEDVPYHNLYNKDGYLASPFNIIL